MKKLLTFGSLLVICMGLYAQNADYLQKKDFLAEKKKISENINGIRKSLATQYKFQDSLKQAQALQNTEVTGLTDLLKRQSFLINELQEKLSISQEKADSFKVYFYIVLLISIVLVLIVFFYFKSLTTRLKTEFLETGQAINAKIDTEFETVRSAIKELDELLSHRNNEVKIKFKELEEIISMNQAEYVKSQQAFTTKLQDQIDEVNRAAETADKSQKEAIYAIEEKLKTRWTSTDAKLAEINAKLLK